MGGHINIFQMKSHRTYAPPRRYMCIIRHCVVDISMYSQWVYAMSYEWWRLTYDKDTRQGGQAI